MARKSYSGDKLRAKKKLAQAQSKTAEPRQEQITSSIPSNFGIIERCLLYKKPTLPKEDADYLMRQSQPRQVDRQLWKWVY
jgi:hypothetical protein